MTNIGWETGPLRVIMLLLMATKTQAVVMAQ